jgi:hypothetical protein
MITITINTANDAFQDNLCAEVAYILESMATNLLEEGGMALNRSVYDSNGNKVGAITMGDE